MGVDYSNGWDVCIATSFANASALLAYAYRQNVLPHGGSGDFSVPLGPVTVPAHVTATVGPWTMVGGTGQNVILTIPFTGGTATIGNQTFQLAGVGMQVTVLLRFVKSTLTGGGTEYQLTLNLTDASAIVAVAITNAPANLSKDDLSALTITLTNLLKSSLAGTGMSLGTVDLSSVASPYPWIIPNRGMEYAAQSTSAGDGALGILLATINAPPGTPATLTAGTIPPGCNAALVVSNQIFTQQFLAPSFASSLNVPVSQMVYGGHNPMLVMLTGNASVSGGTVTSAKASANNGVVSLHLEGNANPMSGVTVNFTIDATYGLTLGGTPQNPVLSFNRTSQNENHSTDIAWWVYVVSGLSGGAIGILVATLIQQVVNHSAGSSLGGALPSGFTKAISWPFAGTINITQALLPTPLQLGGTVTTP
jgi:hypothetical protein